LAHNIEKAVAQNQTLILSAKLKSHFQELEDTCYWLEFISESKIFGEEKLKAKQMEAVE